jgi:hypothetical protein
MQPFREQMSGGQYLSTVETNCMTVAANGLWLQTKERKKYIVSDNTIKLKIMADKKELPGTKERLAFFENVKSKRSRVEAYGLAQRKDLIKKRDETIAKNGWKVAFAAADGNTKKYVNSKLPGLLLVVAGNCFAVHQRNEILQGNTPLEQLEIVLPKLK